MLKYIWVLILSWCHAKSATVVCKSWLFILCMHQLIMDHFSIYLKYLHDLLLKQHLEMCKLCHWVLGRGNALSKERVYFQSRIILPNSEDFSLLLFFSEIFHKSPTTAQNGMQWTYIWTNVCVLLSTSVQILILLNRNARTFSII